MSKENQSITLMISESMQIENIINDNFEQKRNQIESIYSNSEEIIRKFHSVSLSENSIFQKSMSASHQTQKTKKSFTNEQLKTLKNQQQQNSEDELIIESTSESKSRKRNK